MKIFWSGDSTIIADVTDQIPKHKNYPWNYRHSARFYEITNRKITKVVYHQKAGGYDPGFAGVRNTAGFFVRDPQYDSKGNWTGLGRGWPGYGYTIDVPFKPDEQDGKYVVYLCNQLSTVSWHTPGANVDGISIGFQGYFRSRHLKRFLPLKGQSGRPSTIQMEIAQDLWENFCKPKFGLTDHDIRGHFEYGKLSCPGDDLEDFVLRKQNRSRRIVEIPVQPPTQGGYDFSTWELRQAALILLGCSLGEYGPKKNGIDGDPGEMTRLAIESIEKASNLPVDGAWDIKFESALVDMLMMNNITMDQIRELTK